MTSKVRSGAEHRSGRDPSYIARVGRNLTSQTLRSIELLDAIDGTLEALRADTSALHDLGETMRTVGSFLRDAPMSPPFVDPEGRAEQALQGALGGLSNMHKALTARRTAASNDDQLREDDGVVAAFDDALAICRDVYDIVAEVAELLAEALADHEPTVAGQFDSVDEFLAALKS